MKSYARHHRSKEFSKRGIFKKLQSFEQFERRLLKLSDSNTTERGDVFEVLVEAFLYTEPTYKAKEVWPVRSLPFSVRRKLKLPNNIKRKGQGIDGVYLSRDGELVPYQAKFLAEGNQPSFKDTSSFFNITHAHCGDRLLITNRPNVDEFARTRCTALVRRHFETALTPQRLREIERWLGGTKPKPKRVIPRKDQKEALQAIHSELTHADRATVVMACGTGKTLVSVWAAEAQCPKTVLVLVPSLSLMTQTVPDWCQQSRWAGDFRYLCVCSDKTVVSEEDGAEVPPGEAGFPVSTDYRKVRDFLTAKTPDVRVIFSTYQSAEEVARGLPKGFAFDLGIFDEAHKTTGPSAGLFSFALRDQNISIRKRLFFTATPRHYDIRKNKDGDYRSYASMDDETVYGRVAYRLSFKRAVDEQIICPYKIVISVIRSEEVTNKLLKQGSVLVRRRAKHAEDVAKQLALTVAAKKTNAKRMISFHGGIRRAESFKESIGDHLTGYELFHVSGQQNASVRATYMRDFAECGRALITNARCLTEGVNVPTVDLVAFIDPRQSRIDIAQAAGRAMRRPRNYDKKFGYIVVPLFLEQRRGESEEAALKRSGFEGVATVIAAMQEQDEDLLDIIRRLRQEKGEGVDRGASEDLREKVEVLGPTLNFESLSKSIEAEILETLGQSWDYWFGLLVAWRKKSKQLVPEVGEVFNRKKLGVWVATQRANFQRGKLSRDRRHRLAGLEGWFWDYEEWLWSRGVVAAMAFASEFGHLRVPRNYSEGKEFNLEVWIRSVRQREKKGLLSVEKKAEVEKISGWKWNPFFEVWWETYDSLKMACARASLQDIEQARGALGVWVVQQKSRYSAMRGGTKVIRKPLDKEQIAALESLPNWSWDRRRDSWLSHFKAVVEYKKHHHGSLPPTTDKLFTFCGLKIVAWINKERSRIKLRESWQLKMLREGIPELMESPFEAKWRFGYEKLIAYTRKNRTSYVPQKARHDGFTLGSWVSNQRSRYQSGKLPKEKIRLLEQVKGWTWDASSLSASGLSKQGISPAKRARSRP